MSLVDDAAERWAKLPAEKRALLEQRLQRAGLAGTSTGRIAPRPVRGRAVLSYAQERLWFLDQLEPGTIAYNRPWAVRLSGQVDLHALETALNTVVRRHEALRTTSAAVEGRPVQMVQAHQDLPLSVIDLTTLPEAERESEAVRQAVEHSRRPFDLARDLMLRPMLIRLGPEDHVLLLTTHHVAFDGWSEGVLLRELCALYPAFLRGHPSPLPELPLQYADFAHWQRHWLQGETLESLGAFWKAALAGAPDVLELGADHARPLVQTYRGARLTAQVDAQTLQSLKTLSRRTEATLFMTLLAAFQAVLSFHTPQTDLLVGCPIAGRNRLELEELIGFFVDTLVVRGDLGGDPTFVELIGRIRRSALEALAHQDLPFAKLVEILGPRRDLSHLSLVQVTFQLRNLPRVESQLPGVSLAPFEFDAGLARYDLSLEAIERAEGLTCHLTYNLDLFEEATARRFLSEFERALRVLAANPERRLSDLRESLAEAEPAETTTVSKQEGAGDLGERSNLSRNQLRVWLGEQVWPGLPLYNIPFAFTIHRSLDPQHFQRAFQALVDRSDALRTVIEVTQGNPQQRVRADLPFEVLCLDFSNRPHPEQEARAWVQVRCEKPLDLEKRLFDCALLRCSASQWLWYVNLHHLIADLGSVRLIFQYVQNLYRYSVEGRLHEAPGLAAFSEYVDYERGVRRARSTPMGPTSARASIARLDPLRFYGRGAPQRTTRVDKITLDLGAERTRQLKALASQSGFFTKTLDASLLNLTATLLFAYLYRATESRSLVLGVPFYNRPEPFRKTIGLLMEFVPFRVTVEDKETFRSLAHKVILSASAVLQRGVLEEALAAGSKGFEVSLNYLNAAFDQFLGAAVTTEYLSHGHDDDTLAVRLEDYEGAGSLGIGFLFNADTFPPQQQARAVRHFERMLEAMLAKPDECLDDVRLLTEEEKSHLLGAFSGTTAPHSPHASIVEAFEERVRMAPGLVAVVDGKRTLSYERLNAGANRWARYLLGAGIHPGVPVGVCMERSIEWLIAFLGVLKSGGAYLPLDPSLPRERLRVMLEDAGASLVLTRRRWVDALPARQARLVSVEEEGRAVARLAGGNLGPQAGPGDPAYVIYTSGSTGKPKGVVVEHHSLLNFTSWAVREYGLHRGDRMLQFASISWDTSLEETAPALTSGATLVLRPEEMLNSYAGFLKTTHDLGLTVLNLPTAFWHELAEAMRRETLPMPESLRLVIIGGERASPERLQAWRTHVPPGVRLVNTYGLTEAAAVATWCDLTTEGEDPPREAVPIGRPIPNVRAYILDPHQRLTPIGVPGELCLAGEGLARGYINQPERSAGLFLEGPLGEVNEKRLFRTGDLARFLLDGTLVCLGRTDLQVKVRGHRIEPEEIEAHLLKHPGVREVVVVAHPTSEGREKGDVPDSRLVAYVVTARGQTPPRPPELRNFLRASLPDFMLPSAYVMLEALPRTPSGKVDRHALPAPDRRTQEGISSFVAPRNELERRLAQVWQGVLGVRPVGVTDDFFDLGGHSLLAVRLFAQIEKAIGYRLPVRALFEAPTIEGLAALIREKRRVPTGSALVPLQTDGTRPPLFIVHAAGGYVLSFRALARYLGPDQPVYALQDPEADTPSTSSSSVPEMAARYIQDIRSVQPHGPYALGGLSFGGIIAWEMAQQLSRLGEEVTFLALLDTRGPGYRRPTRVANAVYHLRQRLEFHRGNLSRLNTRGKLRYVEERTRTLAGRAYRYLRRGMARAVSAIRQPLPKHVRQAYRAAMRARQEYSPQRYSGHVALFRASRQPRGAYDPLQGWGGLVPGGMEVIEVPGAHFTIITEPYIQALAEQLKEELGRAQGDHREG